jgi:hypothetical protein
MIGRTRLEEFSLSLHPDKTRLIEFGRHAAAQARPGQTEEAAAPAQQQERGRKGRGQILSQ